MSQQPPPSVPSSNASAGSSRRTSPGPTISIENVELLEADRHQHGDKRSKRGNRQQEAADAANAAQGQLMSGGGPPPQQPPYGYPGYDPSQQQQQQYPQDPNSYYYGNYGAPPPGGPGQQPNYGMPYQQGYPQSGQGYYAPPPYGYQQQQAPQGSGQPGATEYTGMLNAGSFDGGYGSLGGRQPAYPPQGPPAGNDALGALNMDDIEKSFSNLVHQPYPGGQAPPSPSTKLPADKPRPPSLASSPRGDRPPSHRRTASNASASSRGKIRHRRAASTGYLPPAGPRSSPAPLGLRKQPDDPRRRSMSGNSVGGHRRTGSFGRSISGDLASVAGSVCSHHSIVSDISKSALFQGVTDEGHVQLHFPYEAIRLVTDEGMKRGSLYMQEIHASEYENYHMAAEEISGWEHTLGGENRFKGLECGCTCTNCNGCTGKKDLLPRAYYAIKVNDDLYRRVLDEIASSRNMPCGLFFCGHYEDVSYPSIRIAFFIVGLVFAYMGYVAFVFQV